MVSKKQKILEIRKKMWNEINRIIEHSENDIKNLLGEEYGSP